MPITAAELSAFGRLDAGAALLRPWQASDAPQLPTLVGDWRVARWLIAVPFPYVESDARFWIRHSGQLRAAGDALGWAIVRKGGDALLGGIELRLGAEGRAELGYWMGLPYQRRGYMRAAVIAALDVATRLGRQAEATVDPLNAASRALLFDAGFVLRGQRMVRTRDGREIIHDFLEKDR
ncbi:GNAT family N-acetyltransferase [Radicibacter daui]|uniref:GNAT family N-acetyltransferase n=1 Tax=Radicibacter daui TaxID=3064829 RepID=UPI004046897A